MFTFVFFCTCKHEYKHVQLIAKVPVNRIFRHCHGRGISTKMVVVHPDNLCEIFTHWRRCNGGNVCYYSLKLRIIVQVLMKIGRVIEQKVTLPLSDICGALLAIDIEACKVTDWCASIAPKNGGAHNLPYTLSQHSI